MIKIRKICIIIHLIVGIGALFGGLLAILNPEAPMGIDVENLPNMPFDSFLVPGLILFVIIGLGNLAGAVIHWKRNVLASYMTGMLGGALVIWIVVQCYMLQVIVALHVIFFLIGCLQGLLALLSIYKQNLFPMNLVGTRYHIGRSQD